MKKYFVAFAALISISTFAASQREINEKFDAEISQYEIENNTNCISLGQEQLASGALDKHTIQHSYGCKSDLASYVVLVQVTLKNHKIHPFKRGPIKEYKPSLSEEQTLRKH